MISTPKGDDHLLTFGTPEPGIVYTDRPGAYAVVLHGKRIAVLQTPIGLFLPGGGVESGETPEQAVLRESIEETGRSLLLDERLGETVDYFKAVPSGRYYRIHSVFFLARFAKGNAIPTTTNHALRWMSPEQGAEQLFRPSQAWAAGALKR